MLVLGAFPRVIPFRHCASFAGESDISLKSLEEIDEAGKPPVYSMIEIAEHAKRLSLSAFQPILLVIRNMRAPSIFCPESEYNARSRRKSVCAWLMARKAVGLR